jgi:Yip1 domain
MKEFLEALAAYGPKFFDDFIGIISGPKRFLRGVDSAKPNSMTQAVNFYVLCLLVAFVMELPFLSTGKQPWSLFPVEVALYLMGTVIIAATFRFLFRLVGGSGSFRDHLVLTLYISGPMYLWGSLGAATTKGIVLVNQPGLYPLFKQYMDETLTFGALSEPHYDALFDQPSVMIAILLSWCLLMSTSIWLLLCWGAYRFLNHVTRFRSFIAVVLAIAISIPLGYALVAAQRGLGLNLF